MSQNEPKWRVRTPRLGEAAGVEVYDGAQYVCQMSHHPAQRAQAAEYARRIVACVNACEGIPTEVLEAYTVLEKLREKDAQRDELLAALELLVSPSISSSRGNGETHIGWQAGDGMTADERLSVARGAIARAKGGAA